MKETYKVIEFDVWGNALDGYEINNQFVTDTRLEVRTRGAGEIGPRAIFQALKRDGRIKAGIRFRSVRFEWLGDGWMIEDVRQPRLTADTDYGWGRPEFRLELVKGAE
jgi:hypothetical protein